MGVARYARVGAVLVFALGAACSDPQPPPAAPLPHLGPDALPDHPLNADGEPVVMQVPLGDDVLELVYDDTREDPIRFWGECLGRVAGCYATNDGSIDGCVQLIEICERSEGGFGCCPEACVNGYVDARAGGLDRDAAVDASFAHGACVPGFVERAAEIGMDTRRAASP